MIYFRIIGALMIGYGLLCFLARDFLYKWTVPRSRRMLMQRPSWNRITIVTGLFSLVLGAFIFTMGR